MPPKSSNGKTVETLIHEDASRRNIPTAEYQSVMRPEELTPLRVAYERRNRDLDPQLVWRGKDQQDWSDLVVPAPPLYIQEKVHPKVLIDDLLRQSKQAHIRDQFDLFADFNGLPSEAARTEFYQHEAHWSNRMILGDSLQVMASLAEREGLRGKVQCIYIDPPYGIKFNSNFQWSTTSRDVKDGNVGHITREPEQVKAFRDTWRDGIHSYLTYLRDRLTVARDLLSESGSVFVQIGDENVHRVRSAMDEVFGEDNFAAQIAFIKTSAVNSPEARTNVIGDLFDYLLWYSKDIRSIKYRQPYRRKEFGGLHLCESLTLSSRLLGRLYAAGVLCIDPSTPPDAVELGTDQEWRYYPHRVVWRFADDALGRSFPEIMTFLAEVIDAREDDPEYGPAVIELWRLLAYDDALNHLTTEVSAYSLPEVKVGPKTDQAIWHALEHFSIPQVRREITNVVKNAAALSQHRDYHRRHALNTIPGTLINYVDRARSEGWNLSPMLRNWQNEEPILLTVLFNRVLATGLPGFKSLTNSMLAFAFQSVTQPG